MALERKQAAPERLPAVLPRHVAIIMDGNGRWARRRSLPRQAGHSAGVKTAKQIVEACARKGIEALTLFAFSSENWHRPVQEVSLLMSLFVEVLQREVDELHENGIGLRFIGERDNLATELREQMAAAERRTAANERMQLVIAVAYGGQWDIVQAVRRIAERVRRGELQPADVDAAQLRGALALGDLPDPDLFIRTGGERRISNFLLWNLAYTELYFSEALWPDFDVTDLDEALEFFAGRQRRFGRTAEQLELP